jgi:hypothetical protein
MTGTTYVKDLGKCVAKQGNYRAYKEGRFFALYLISKELIWNADGTDYKVGTRLVAVQVASFVDLRSFEIAVDSAEEEIAYMMAEAK